MKKLLTNLATWGVALLAVIPLGCLWLAAQDGVAVGVSTDQPAALVNEQSAPPAPPAQEQPEVLSRGPVHEAFAAPVDLQAQEGLLVPTQPPANIEEVPPEERPQGQQYAWIPGYWSWDTDRSGYIWVSACWRVAPPNMAWVPGYWSQVFGGYKWVAGFWAPAGVQEIEYLQAPPALGNVEPSGAPPSPDALWVPPCMYWVQGQYTLRPGYWMTAQPNWIWEPSHYVWTPRGYIFAEGHWDYSVARRGMLFAPVYFPPAIYAQPAFAYTPGIVLNLGLLQINLFAYPRYNHYYFGDYYADAYLSIGIFPWFDSRRLHTWYDPVFEHDRWRHRRSEPRWEERERDDYNRRRADVNLRPARTFREQESRLAKLPEAQRSAFQVAQPIAVAVTRKTPLKFERINTDERQKISKQATAVRTFRDERTRWETTAATPKAGQAPKAGKVAGPQVGKPAKESSGVVAGPGAKTVQPPKERGGAVTAPGPATVRPPQQGAGAVAAPSPKTAQPPKERSATVTAPSPKTAQPPKERGGTVTGPVAQRAPASAPARAATVPKPERVKIPVPPISGRAVVPGSLKKGPPVRPADENTVKGGVNIPNRAADKDTRQNKNKRN
ncbi:MAG: hypothetical protein NTV22_00085 [bacterium]|nr:hypothetical protein [bacterium]